MKKLLDIVVDPQIVSEIQALEKAIEGREINTESEEEDAVRLIQIAKDRFRKLEKARKEHTKPLNDRKRAIDRLFKPFTNRLSQIERKLKTAVFQSTQRREEANRRAMVAAQQAAQAGAPTVAQHLDAIDDRPLPASTSMRKFWEFQVVDPSKVPGQFWSPDPEKIKAELVKHTDFARPPVIPGVRIAVGGSLTVRKGKA